MFALLLSAVHSVLLPLAQRATRRDELEAIFARYRRAVLAVVPFVLLGVWASAWFIPLVDGGKYPGAIDVFRVLCVSTVVGLAFSPYVHLLFRYSDFAFLFGLACAALALNVGLAAALVPTLHALGAAAAVCIAAGALNLLIYVRARTLLAWRPLPALAIGAGEAQGG
jgi:O-antigen/teichoic acid export membrane protein